MSKDFEPKGDEPRWKAIWPLFENAAEDDVVTYDELADALGVDAKHDRVAIQGVVGQLRRKLLVKTEKAFVPVANKGYRIVKAGEHFDLAQVEQKKARRRLKRTHDLVVYTDRNGMDPTHRGKLDLAERLVAAQINFNRRTDLRLKNLEKASEAATSHFERSDEEAAALRERVERLERLLGEKSSAPA